MAGILASLIIRALLLGLDAHYSPDDFDLLQGEVIDTIKKPTLNNMCVLSVTGFAGTVDESVRNINAWVKCQDKQSLVGSWLNVPAGQDLKVSDPRVGDFTLNFQSSHFNTFPFPGDLIVYNSYWKDSAFKTGIGMKNCINFSEKGTIIAKDCKGKQVVTKVCQEGFADGSYGVINHDNVLKRGWIYQMAVPQQGVNPGCPDPGAKVKRVLSRFEVEDEVQDEE